MMCTYTLILMWTGALTLKWYMDHLWMWAYMSKKSKLVNIAKVLHNSVMINVEIHNHLHSDIPSCKIQSNLYWIISSEVRCILSLCKKHVNSYCTHSSCHSQAKTWKKNILSKVLLLPVCLVYLVPQLSHLRIMIIPVNTKIMCNQMASWSKQQFLLLFFVYLRLNCFRS